jgi:peptide/nickel transport system substrate-binding protein
LSSKAVRQALAYTIPKPEDSKQRALGPINPKSWANNPQIKSYSYSLETAKELLEGEFNQDDALPSIELTTTQAYADLADQIAESWRLLGFEVNLKIVNFPDTIGFQALLIGQQSPSDPDQYTLWHSTQATNFTHYNSPRVDKLLEDGRKIIDKDERTLIYQDFQRFLVEDTPAIFISHLTTNTIER